MESPPFPVAGRDYPRTFEEFDRWFSDEEACQRYLIRVRWAAGFRCPHCSWQGEPWVTARGLFHCRACQNQVSATAATVMDGTRKPLRVWFLAMWFVTSQKHGASALGLQGILGLQSYQTAWAWLHKLRRAMVRPGREPLEGPVEVDETYVGGPEEGVHGRETEGKSIVVVAAEVRERVIGRIRLRRVADVSSESLLPFVCEVVAPRAVVRTDGWPGYAGLGDKGYRHRVINLSRRRGKAHELLPSTHRVVSLLKRWLLGTHQGAVSRQHIDYYLDEFTFRFNRRSSRSRGLLFYRLLQQAVATDPVPYRRLVGRG